MKSMKQSLAVDLFPPQYVTQLLSNPSFASSSLTAVVLFPTHPLHISDSCGLPSRQLANAN